MLAVITGVSGSGKSEYAENRAVELSCGKDLYYVATMEPYGEEGRERIERHHKLRAGKGFTTIECYRNIECIVDMIGADQCKEATIPLECMSNLLTNEMFPKPDSLSERETMQQAEVCMQIEQPATEQSITNRLLSGISFISRQCKHHIIVTNEIFSDGIDYGEETMVYIKFPGTIKQTLVKMADEAMEVVYTVPIKIL